MATSTRSSSVTPSIARSTTRLRCSATRSATSAGRTPVSVATRRPSIPANCPASTSVTNTSYSPGGNGSVTAPV